MDLYHKIEQYESGYIVLEKDGADTHHRRLIACCTSPSIAIRVRQALDLLLTKEQGAHQPSEDDVESTLTFE
jgi:hypothetical protein